MSKLSAPSQPRRLRLLAIIGAVALAIGISPTAAMAAPGDPGVVHGTVTNAVTHAGIAGIDVSTYSSDYSVYLSTTTDASGAYSFAELPIDSYTVNPSLFGLPYQFASGTTVALTAAQPSGVADFALVPYASGSSVIGGVVTDSASGTPIPGANVSISGVDVVYYGNAVSDAAGAYSFPGLAVGTYSLFASTSGYAGSGSGEVSVGGTPLVQNISLVKLDASISGRVTDPEGTGIAGLWVDVSGPSIGSAQTDSLGYYSISNLGAGNHVVSVGGNFSTWSRQEVSVTITAASALAQDFTLSARTTSTVLGLVFGEDYTAAADVCVDLIAAGDGHVVASTTSWLDSTYTFENVANGVYSLWFEDCDPTRVPPFQSTFLGGSATLAGATTFAITHGADDRQVEDTHLTLAAVSTGSITLTITDAKTGKAVTKGVRGTIVAAAGGPAIGRDVDGSGVIAFTDLALGVYNVSVVAPGFQTEKFSLTLTSDGPDVDGTVSLDRPGKSTCKSHGYGQGHSHKKPHPKPQNHHRGHSRSHGH